MAQLALSIGGAMIGGAFGYPLLGYAAGSILGSMLFPPDKRKVTVEGARLSNLTIQTATWGQPIPKTYGTDLIAGNVIWQTRIREVKKVNQQTETVGGKGGFGRGQKTVTKTISYSYYVDLAICFGEGPISGIRKLYADGKLIYKAAGSTDSPVQDMGNGGILSFTFYPGSETQTADSVIEAVEGTVNANRGLCYIVIDDFEITKFGRVPNFTAEIVAEGNTNLYNDYPFALSNTWDMTGLDSNTGDMNNLRPQVDPGTGLIYGSTPYGQVGEYNSNDLSLRLLPILNKPSSLALCPGDADLGFPTRLLGMNYWEGIYLEADSVLYCPQTNEVVEGELMSNFYSFVAGPTLPALSWYPAVGGGPVVHYPPLFLSLTPTTDPFTGEALYYNQYFVMMPLYGIISILEDDPFSGNFPSEYDYATGAMLSVIDPFTYNLDWAKVHAPDYDPPTYSYTGTVGLGGSLWPASLCKTTPGFGTQYAWSWVDVIFCGEYTDYYSTKPLAALREDYASIYFIRFDPTTGSLKATTIQVSTGISAYSDLRHLGPLYTINGATSPQFNLAYDKKRDVVFFGYCTVAAGTSLKIFYTDVDGPTGTTITFTKAQIDAVYGAVTNYGNATYGCALYHTVKDKWYFFLGGYVFKINPDTYALEAVRELVLSNSYWAPTFVVEVPRKNWVFGTSLKNDGMRIYLDDIYAIDVTPLSDVVEDICLSTRLTGGAINTTDLATVDVRGYTRTNQISALNLINELRSIYHFDGILNAGTITFRLRDGISAVDSIPLDDLFMEAEGPIAFTRRSDNILPNVVQVLYRAADSHYNQAVSFARKNSNTTNASIQIDTTAVLENDEALQSAEKSLESLWNERIEYSFSTGYKYIDLLVGDVVTVESFDLTHTVMLTAKDTSMPGRIAWKAVSFDTATYSNNHTGIGPVWVHRPVSTTKSDFILLDIPTLTYSTDGLGMYTAIYPHTADTNWPGGILFKANGNTWSEIYYEDVAPNVGYAVTELAAGPVYVYDTVNTFTVIMQKALASVTETELLDGANLFRVGGEILQAKTCTVQMDGTYVLSNLVRGLYNTEQEVGNHAAGELVLLLDDVKLDFVQLPQSELNVGVSYGAGTLYTQMSAISTRKFTLSGAKIKQFSPVHLVGIRDSVSGDIVFTWIKRGRISAEWYDLDDIVTPEITGYELDVYAGTSIARTLSSTGTAETVTYTAADQVSDGTDLETSLYVEIYAKSAGIGRGFRGPFTVTLG